MQSSDLFLLLNSTTKFDFKTNPFWWPKYSTFWVVIGAVLTQNTKWANVEKSLLNLQNARISGLESMLDMSQADLADLIRPSGFYNIKAKRLLLLCSNILDKFGDFECFSRLASRKWLISQKGIGLESVDVILCYACKRDIMVVDKYTSRILEFLNFSFDSYEEIREWLENIDRKIVHKELFTMSDNELFARFHGLIVEFCKEHYRSGDFDNYAKNMLSSLL